MQRLGWDSKLKAKKRKSGKRGAPPEVGVGERGGVPGADHSALTHDDSQLHEIEFDHDHESRTPRTPSREVHSPSQEAHRRSLSQHFAHRRDPSLPHWRKSAWENVRVGDFLKITNEEAFPADMLICSTSEEENVCFVETKNLDGETNLKSRNAVPVLTHLRSADDCADREKARFHIELDRPDPNMYKLNGAVVKDGQKHPIDLQTVLLRGTVLKNTKWVIGVVMYTGEDTKIMLNSGGTPSKRSKVERQMNPQVCVCQLVSSFYVF